MHERMEKHLLIPVWIERHIFVNSSNEIRIHRIGYRQIFNLRTPLPGEFLKFGD